MKVSLNWAKEFMDVRLPVGELVNKIGAQLGAVEETIDLGKKFQGIIVARVVKCEKHSNADKLSLCLVDDGGKVQDVARDENGYVQVVCGAPNVREELLVAWLPPGATVPSSVDKDPFVLEARELRGKVSNGMLASASELAISDDHNGILELNLDDAKPGDDFADVYKLNDHIIDIENKMFTHRPDLFGQLGVAREIAGITHQKFTSPQWYLDRPRFTDGDGTGDMVVEVKNDVPELAPRFMAAPMRITSNGPSPAWLQTYLSRVGLRPINTIVDITNYLMMLTAQPLHAYDYDKLLALNESDRAVITIRKPQKGEKLQLLNGKEIEPRNDAIMIAGDKHLLGVAGVMGGGDTEVDENTRRIVLEVATFDMYSIRRTAMEHGLFTDAVTRFNKGQSPLQNDRVMAKAIEMVQELAGGHVAGVVQDDDHTDKQDRTVEVTVPFVNERLGLVLTIDEMKSLLQNVEFTVDVSVDTMLVTVPFWRMDIDIPEDIVEEVGRLYGFDHLPLTLPVRDLTPTPKNMLLEIKNQIRDVLSTAGANEVLAYSFIPGSLLERAGQEKDQAYKISNALSPELQYYRLSLTPSLLEKVHPNIKAGYDQFAIFEINKVHSKTEIDEERLPREFERIAMVFAANDRRAQDNPGAPYFNAKRYLEILLDVSTVSLVPFSVDLLSGHDLSLQMVAPFEPGRCALVYDGERYVGIVGEYKKAVRNKFKLPDCSAGFEVFLSAIQSSKASYTPLPKFPRVEQDMSLKVPMSLHYQDLYDFLRRALDELRTENTYQQLSPVDIYRRSDDADHKQVTLRYTIASYDKTMTAEEVNSLLNRAADLAKEKFGAERL